MATRTVTGTYLGADGQPLEGRLYFAPVWRLTDPTEQTIVLPVPATVDLDASGTFSVDLLTTDSANPAGWVWEVTERVGNTHATWHFALPADSAPLDLADVAPAEAPVTGALTYASGSILPATTNADDGAVLQVFGPNKTPQWSDNLTAYGSRIDSNDARLNDLTTRVTALETAGHPAQPAGADPLDAVIHAAVIDYDNSQGNNEGAVVRFGGELWLAKRDTNPGQSPATNPGSWLSISLDDTALKAQHALTKAEAIIAAAASATDWAAFKTALAGL